MSRMPVIRHNLFNHFEHEVTELSKYQNTNQANTETYTRFHFRSFIILDFYK